MAKDALFGPAISFTMNRLARIGWSPMSMATDSHGADASGKAMTVRRLKLRPWPIRIWNHYRVYRRLGGRLWSLKAAIEIAFSSGQCND